MAKESQNIIRCTRIMAVARALIGGGGGVYSYIRVMPDGFLLKSVVFKFISKEISRAYHEYMNTPPPPSPMNALATALTRIRYTQQAIAVVGFTYWS